MPQGCTSSHRKPPPESILPQPPQAAWHVALHGDFGSLRESTAGWCTRSHRAPRAAAQHSLAASSARGGDVLRRSRPQPLARAQAESQSPAAAWAGRPRGPAACRAVFELAGLRGGEQEHCRTSAWGRCRRGDRVVEREGSAARGREEGQGDTRQAAQGRQPGMLPSRHWNSPQTDPVLPPTPAGK